MHGRNAREWTRKCALLLPEIVRERVWEKKGFGSVYEYAGRLAGMGRNAVDDALRILHSIENMPELQKVVEIKGLNAVRPIVAVATPETELFWAAKAMEMSKHTLELYIKERRESRTGTGNNVEFPEQQAIEKTTLMLELDPEVASKLEKLKGKDGDWNTLMKELLAMREKMLVQEKPEEKVTESRHIPANIERFVVERARGVCEFRACEKKYEILHHIQRFALEKTHDPSRIVALCKPHERMVHLGLIEDEHILPAQWKVTKEANRNDPKYQIDRLVQRYRQKE